MENTEEQKSISIEKKSEKELENYRESLDQAYTKLEYSTHFLSYLEPYITDLDLAISGKLPKEKEELFVNFLSLAGRRILKNTKSMMSMPKQSTNFFKNVYCMHPFESKTKIPR